MNRRSLLTAVLGLAGSAATGARPSDAIAAAKGLGGLGLYDDGFGNNVVGDAPPSRLGTPWHTLMDIRGSLERQTYRLDDHPPARITTKRSWSPAFKEMCLERHRRDLERAIAAMQNDSTAEHIARVLGLWPLKGAKP